MCNMTKTLSALCFIFLAIQTDAKYTDCGSKKATLENVELVPPCGDVCIFTRGQNVTIKLSFKANEVANKITARVHGIIGGVPFPFPLPSPNACENSGLECPLKASSEYVYHKDMAILDSYPRLFVTVKFELVDESGVDLVCAEFPAQIQ